MVNIFEDGPKAHLYGYAALKVIHEVITVPFYARKLEEPLTGSTFCHRWKKLIQVALDLFHDPPDSKN